MAWRWRKALRAGWFRLNFSRTGTGWSLGPRFCRFGVAANGRRYISFGIPGTGLYCFKYVDWSKAVLASHTGAVGPPSQSASSVIRTRARIVVVLDTSMSTSSEVLESIGNGLTDYVMALRRDPRASAATEIAVLTLGDGIGKPQFFAPGSFVQPEISPGDTGEPLNVLGKALELAGRGDSQCKAAVFFLSSGSGLRSAHSIADDIERGERSGAFAFFAIGLEDADLQTLARFAMRAPLRLRTTEVADFFGWLARTSLELARSSPGAEVGLELPAWAS